MNKNVNKSRDSNITDVLELSVGIQHILDGLEIDPISIFRLVWNKAANLLDHHRGRLTMLLASFLSSLTS
jgi:hypothetical protein